MHASVGSFEAVAADLREEVLAVELLVLWYVAGVQEVVVVDVLTLVSGLVPEMAVELFPQLFLRLPFSASIVLACLIRIQILLLAERSASVPGILVGVGHVRMVRILRRRVHPPHELVVLGRVLAPHTVVVSLERCPVPSNLVHPVVSYFLLHSLVDNHHWICWPIQQPLEMHGVVDLRLRIDGLGEAEVVVSLFEGVEGDVSVELAKWVRLVFHIHVVDII